MTQNTIKITNISPKASEKTIADFFSFCGKIQNLTMRRQGSSVEAIVEFETEAAAKTALLLTNALIEDRPITVTSYDAVIPAAGAAAAPEPVATASSATTSDTAKAPVTDHSKVVDLESGAHSHEAGHAAAAAGASTTATSSTEPVHVTHMDQRDIPNKPIGENATNSSVIASLLASGYTLGVGALDAAREVDEKTHLTQTISAGAEAAKHKLQEFDQHLGITDAASAIGMQIAQGASALGEGISSAWRNIDNSYQVTEKTAAASNTVSDTVRSATTAALENPTVASTVNTLSSWGAALTGMVAPYAESAGREVEEIRQATKQKIDAVDRSRASPVNEADAGGLSKPTTTATATTGTASNSPSPTSSGNPSPPGAAAMPEASPVV